MIKVYMFLLIMGIIGGVGYGGYIYYKDTQQRIQTLAENSAKLEQAAKIQEETINTMIEDRERLDGLNKGLQKELQTATRYGDQLRNTLRKHNLTKIGSGAPDHILRSTFENAYLSGDVSNKNGDILLHNWHKEEEV